MQTERRGGGGRVEKGMHLVQQWSTCIVQQCYVQSVFLLLVHVQSSSILYIVSRIRLECWNATDNKMSTAIDGVHVRTVYTF